MPKDKENVFSRAKKLIAGNNYNYFEVQSKNDSVLIFCKLCSSKFKVDALHLKTQFQSHVESAKHKKSSEKNVLQPSISNAIASTHTNSSKMNSYSVKLANAFIQAGIPLWKLRHPSIKQFFLEEHKEVLPSMRVFYEKIQLIYDEALRKIKDHIGENAIYLIVDETTDVCKRYVLNILVGKIDGTYAKPMLLSTTYLEKTNNMTVQQAVHRVCALLFGADIPFEKVWFLISDQAPYMLKAGRNLKEIFPHLKHITCVIHALNRVCEFIKDQHDTINELIAAMKATLSKSNARRQIYSEITKLRLPPDVFEVRWNLWLNAAFFYAENFSAIKSFVAALQIDSKSVERLKKCIDSPELEAELFEVHKYSFLTKAITRLEKHGLTVQEQLAILNDVKSKLSGFELAKLEESLSKNPDVNFYENMSVNQKIKCKYMPMTSVDVERSFSIYRYILSDRRHSLSESKLAMLNVIQYNNFMQFDDS